MIGFQGCYTFATLLPVFLMYKNIWIHGMVLLIAFGSAVWNGSKFYFDIFSENYSKRLEQKWKELNDTTEVTVDPGTSYTPSSILSVIKFLFFFLVIWTGGIIGLHKALY